MTTYRLFYSESKWKLQKEDSHKATVAFGGACMTTAISMASRMLKDSESLLKIHLEAGSIEERSFFKLA